MILASASPRRQELLRNAGIAFTAQPSNIAEILIEGEAARTCAERLATEKTRSVRKRFPEEVVLGADTLVVTADEILGKPRDRDDAERMLRMLSGKTHEVITGVCLAGNNSQSQTGFEDVRSERTSVSMCEISDQEIRQYAATGEPMDKAGAYAIQGMASRWIYRIEGDYCNVVGLPVSLVCRMLREHGLEY